METDDWVEERVEKAKDRIIVGKQGLSQFEGGYDRRNIAQAEGPYHIWTTGITQPFPCLGNERRGERPPPAGGCTGLNSYVLSYDRFGWSSLEEMLLDEEVCRDCREALYDWLMGGEGEPGNYIAPRDFTGVDPPADRQSSHAEECAACGSAITGDNYIERNGELYCDIDCLNRRLVQ